MKRLFLFIAALFVFLTLPQAAFAQIATTEKMIVVDRGKQMLYAWEGGKIVHQTKVSTGMYLTPTVRGSFKIQRKYPVQDMAGPSPYKWIYPSGKYYIKNVPNVMYFYQGYAIHGVTWHTKFGTPASHGCVNVPVASAQWLFDWAGMGTRVEVF